MNTGIRHQYVSVSSGEIHVRRFAARGETGRTLICLHPAPYSGIYFETIMPLLAEACEVIAPDYPGYGGSGAPAELPDIGDYARAMLEVVDVLGLESPDLLGFHTGSLVAVEMARQASTGIGRLLLVDIPFFTGSARDEMYANAAQPRNLNDDPASLADSFAFNVTRRAHSVDYDRAFALFLEQLRPGNRSHWAFHAAFTYAAEEAFAAIRQPGVIFATHSSLLEPTRAAAECLSAMELIEKPEIKRSVFEDGAVEMAAEINRYLLAGEKA